MVFQQRPYLVVPHRAYAKAVLEYDASLGDYDLVARPKISPAAELRSDLVRHHRHEDGRDRRVDPPVGINAFVVKEASNQLTLSDVFKGCAPFVVLEILIVVILVIFPQIAYYGK